MGKVRQRELFAKDEDEGKEMTVTSMSFQPSLGEKKRKSDREVKGRRSLSLFNALLHLPYKACLKNAIIIKL